MMLKTKTVKFNFLMNAILTASSFLFPVLSFPYVSRVLLPEGIGRVNFATAIAYYFTMFAMLGAPTYGVRACARVRDDRRELSRTVQEILLINMIAGIIAYGGYFLAVWKIPRLRSDSVLFYIMGAAIFLNIIGVEWLYKGLEEYSYITIRSIAFKLASLVLMFLFVKEQKDYVIYGAVSLLANAGYNLLNLWNLKKYISLYPLRDVHILRHLKPILIFFLMSIATTIYTNLDTVMLGFMKSDVEVGYYSAAVKVKNILVSLVTALGTVMLPRVSYYMEHHMENEFVQICRKALDFVMVAALPLTVYFILFAKESVLLLSGNTFLGAALPMQIIMPTVFFIGITNVLGIQIMVPLGREKCVFYSVLVGAVVDLMINLICIPSMASSGAAFGTLIAELVVLIIQVILLKSQIKTLLHSIHIEKLIIAVICAVLTCLWVKQLTLSTFLVLLLSASLFFVIYGLVLLILKEELIYDITLQIWNTTLKSVFGRKESK